MRWKEQAIVIVEPDAGIRDGLQAYMNSFGLSAHCYGEANAFLRDFATVRNVACLVVDAELPGVSSVELVRILRRRGTDLPVIVLAGSSDRATAAQALRAGAIEVIDKPLLNDSLFQSIVGLLR